MAQDIPISDA